MKKKNLAFVTGIMLIVFGGLALLAGIFLAGMSEGVAFNFARTPRMLLSINGAMISIGVMLILSSFAQVLMGIVLLRAKSEKITNKIINSLMIAVIVLSVFMGGIVILIFAIITLSVKDGASQVGGTDFDSTYARFKQYLADGVITEEEFKKRVHELTDKFLV
jgi:uncharacterized membrane protein